MKYLKDKRTYLLIGATILLFLAIFKADSAIDYCQILCSDFHKNGTPQEGIIAGFGFIGFMALLVFVIKD